MTTLPNHWPALIAAARMARVVECDQRAYIDTCNAVRFYPTGLIRYRNGHWESTVYTEADCYSVDRRLPDADAAALWATRPEGVK